MIKVAGYCRVSTDQEDQANSFASQQRYFREYIANHPDWELHEIYADEGITGTSTQKRTQFNRMIRDAHAGKFALIITKEVSRFSRNILDTISYTRSLKAIGVGVRFAIDGIDTLAPDAELYLAIMASLAQEESRKTSARVVWGQMRQMEKGVVFGRSLLGYDVTGGRITVNPEGAKTVALIFGKYALEKLSTGAIAEYLNREGIPTCSGAGKWTPGAVIRILKNEKYVGDLIQKKSYTPDFLTHRKCKNTGQVPLVTIKNHHAPIVSREIWEIAQQLLRKNNKHTALPEIHSNRYAFSGKITCGECGAGFVARIKYRSDGTGIRRWSCAAAAGGGNSCRVGKLLRSDDAMQMLQTALQSLEFDRQAVIKTVTDAVMEVLHGPAEQRKEILCRMDRIRKKREAALDAYLSGSLSETDLSSLLQRSALRLKNLQAQLEEDSGPGASQVPTEEAVAQAVADILEGKTESEVFCKNILAGITVFKDRHSELRLMHLGHVFHFTEQRGSS